MSDPASALPAAVFVPVDRLRAWARNPRDNDPAVPGVVASIVRFGFGAPLLARQENGELIAGHTRLKAIAALPAAWAAADQAERLRWNPEAQALAQATVPAVPVRYMALSESEAHALALADNKVGEAAGWHDADLAGVLHDLRAADVDVTGLGWSDQDLAALIAAAPLPGGTGGAGGDPNGDLAARPSLADRFGVPPFSVLDARQGYWQARKAQWIAIGIKSELGRGAGAFMADPGMQSRQAWRKDADGKPAAEGNPLPETASLRGGLTSQTSIHPYDATGQATNERTKKGRKANAIPGGAPIQRHRGTARDRSARANATPGGSALPSAKLGQNGTTQRDDGAGRPMPGPSGNFVQGVLMKSDSGNDPAYYLKKQTVERYLGRQLSTEEFQRDWYTGSDSYQSGTSIFDPVLCELIYRWFSPVGGLILDPFAGGSVRGIVASVCGRRYVGVDLRPEQLAANIEQAAAMELDPIPDWRIGDSAGLATICGDVEADLFFSCPPYGDLERYSDDPADLSTMAHADFVIGYRAIIAAGVARLKPDRFAAFIVGDFCDDRGFYRNFVADTIAAFEAAGAYLYNEAILVTACGSLPIRAGKQFASSRKLGKTHQNVLVFFKGDPTTIRANMGEVAFPEELFTAEPVSGDPPVAATPAAADDDYDPVDDGAEPTAPVVLYAPPRGPTGGPDWAKGYDVAALKAITGLFAQQHAPYTLSRFSRIDDRAIAEAADTGRLYVAQDAGRIIAAVIARTAKAASPILDFADRTIGRVEVGDLRIDRVVALPGAEPVLLALLRDLIGARPTWVEVWQEHAPDRALVEALGLRWCGSRITAASEIRGVYEQGHRADATSAVPSAERAHLVALRLPTVDTAPLLAAIDRLGPAWADHYSTYNLRQSWQAVALRGFGGDPAFIAKPIEMAKAWKEANPAALAWPVADTPLRAMLPEAEAILALIPGQHERVRLMRLRGGGGELARHSDITDPDAGVAPGKLLRIHVPLRTAPGVQFDGWLLDGSQRRVHMPVGSVYYLDTRKPHRAVNPGDIERIHLVVDVASTPALLALLPTD